MTGPGKFRKKPVVIEAIQLTWSNWSDVCAFVPRPYFDHGVYLDPATKEELPEGKVSTMMGLRLRTLENGKEDTLLATENDWIIKGVNGEFYPCKPDVFDKTYEPVG